MFLKPKLAAERAFDAQPAGYSTRYSHSSLRHWLDCGLTLFFRNTTFHQVTIHFYNCDPFFFPSVVFVVLLVPLRTDGSLRLLHRMRHAACCWISRAGVDTAMGMLFLQPQVTTLMNTQVPKTSFLTVGAPPGGAGFPVACWQQCGGCCVIALSALGRKFKQQACGWCCLFIQTYWQAFRDLDWVMGNSAIHCALDASASILVQSIRRLPGRSALGDTTVTWHAAQC